MLRTCDCSLVVEFIILCSQWIIIIIIASNHIVVVVIVNWRVQSIEFTIEKEILEGTQA